ncbi:MAG: response regulator [Balneolaceae bacterium]
MQGIELTQRKKAEEALRAMNKTLEERVEERTSSLLSYQKQLRSLVSELSTAEENQRRYLATELHDNLGQLLAMCKMELDLVKGGKLPSPAASVINKVTELLNEVISYTRQLMSELKPPPVLNKEDIEAYIFWAADQMKKHGLTVSVQSNDEPKPIDEEAKIPLLQSVRELLMNVAQHSGVKKARVTTSCLENHMQVTVEDEGVGFDSEEEFIESDDGGFGLFNIQERMEMLGGRLELVSVPQQGTRATLFIPLKSEEKTGTPDRDNEKKSNSSVQISFSSKLDQKITVLIADDHEMVRKGLRNLIEKEADLVVIAEAADGTEAVKFAGELFPDVIVMDVNMPAMDGIEATQLIKKKMPEVYIIGLSLHDDEQVSNEMRKAGASAYLSKTEAFETLCATIRNEFNPSV